MPPPKPKKQGPDQVFAFFKIAMKQLSPEDRVEVLNNMASEFCTTCGCEQPEWPKRKCQCWNDE